MSMRDSAFRLEYWAGAIGLATVAAIAASAMSHNRSLAAIACATSALAVLWAGHVATGAHAAGRSGPLAVLRETTRLSVWTLAWSSAALFVAYPVVGLKWQHGWQYASGYALLALGFAIFLFRLHAPAADSPAVLSLIRTLATIFAALLAAALLWLIGSGKLSTLRQDWLANDVFLASAGAVLGLTLLFLRRAR